MTARIHVERLMHRSSIAVSGDSAASYALIKLVPAAEATKPLPVNLALVLDVSGSMYELDGTGVSRLQRIQDAALAAAEKLRPDDTVAVVAFAKNAQVVLPAVPLADRARFREVLQQIDTFDVDPAGTAMDQGISLGLAEVGKNAGEGRLSQLVVLTDGETGGERHCRELAQQAARDKVRLTVMGVGTEWNSGLIKDLAQLGAGTWYYIDVQRAEDAQRAFLREFEHLAAAGFSNVALHARPVKDVRVKRARMVVPEIRELKLAEPEERHYVAELSTLGVDQPTRCILDLSLPKRPDGKYVICRLEVIYGLAGGRRESTGMVPLEMQYRLAGQGYVNAEVARHIDEVQIFEMNQNLQQALAADNKGEAVRLAETIAHKATGLGPRAAKKTMLAHQVLNELHAGGRVSRKTQLAVDDAARSAEELQS